MRRRPKRRISVREAARRSRRDLRILLAITAAAVGVFLIAQPGRGAQEQEEPAVDERLKEFKPTEEISADRAIAFPVDI